MYYRPTALRHLVLVALGSVVGAASLQAQTLNARVANQGTVGLRVGAEFSLFDARFGHPFRANDSDRQPLASEAFVGRISDESFPPFGTLRTQLNAFFAAFPTDPFTVAPGGLAVTTEAFEASADHRVVPFDLELGVLPRVSVGVHVPLVQHWLTITGFPTGAGNIGWNADAALNRTLLAVVDSQFAALGESRFLPTRNSPAGVALRQRVAQATGGQEPSLPEAPVSRVGTDGIVGSEEIVTGRYSPARPAWELGDAEVRLSFQVLQPAPETAAAAPLSVWAAVDVGVRLPTGTAPAVDYAVVPKPLQGLGGVSAALRTDMRSHRFGALAGLRLERLGGVSLAHPFWPAPAEEGLVGERSTVDLQWEPGTRISLDLVPYARLVDEIRMLVSYGYRRRSESFTLVSEPPGGGFAEAIVGDGVATAQQWGAGIEYSTVRSYARGTVGAPFEASILVRNSFAGSGGAPADRTVQMQARFFVRLWGGR